MSFYVIKYVVPIAISSTIGTWAPYGIRPQDVMIAQEDRVNLLERDYLVSGTSPTGAIHSFFCKAPLQQVQIHGVPAENGAGLSLPLMVNRWYMIKIIGSRGIEYDYMFLPNICSGGSTLMKVHDYYREQIGNIPIECIPGPYDELIKQRKTAALAAPISLEYKAMASDISPRVAYAIKELRKELKIVDAVVAR